MLLFLFLSSGKVVAATVDELKAQQQEIQSKIDDLNKQVEDRKNQAVNLENQIAIFDARIAQVELQIEDTQLEIETKQGEIDNLTIEIGRQQRMLEYQQRILDDSLQIIYERREQSLLSVLLSSKNFSDFVEQISYLETVKEQVRSTILEINNIKSSLEEKRGTLSDQKRQLEELYDLKRDEQKTLEDQKQVKQIILDQTKGEEEEFQKQLNQSQEEEKSVEAEIDKQIEEAKRKLLEKYPKLEGGQGFGYPLNGENRISVLGGDYMDPYYGFGFPHTGIDLAAAQSTPIFSAGDGIIISAYDSGGAGLSYIAIQHTNGLMTKYLHMSEIFVVSGQQISRGEAIGLSGGMPGTRGAGYFTTGPHLHFEIDDENGNSVNPHNFLEIEPAI